jgi:phenylacetate-CoA ligase
MLVVKGINVFPQAIAGIVSGFRDVLTGEYQVVVDTPPPHDDLLVEIEQLPGVAPSTLDEIRVRLVRSIRARLDFTARVRFVPQGSIIRRGDKTERIRREYSGD